MERVTRHAFVSDRVSDDAFSTSVTLRPVPPRGEPGAYDHAAGQPRVLHPVETSLAIHPGVAHGPLYEVAKRVFDVLFALVLLVAASPVWLVAVVLVLLTSPGPVLFRQTRCGQAGKPFTCYKLRTMVDGAHLLIERDEQLRQVFAENWKLRTDPRVTRVGRWLRKTSIDELPQLLNVLRGDMSIVGPRPVLPKELHDCYGEHASIFCSVKPGLTGLWQVSGRSLLTYEQRIELDLEYVARRSFRFDMLLVLRTVPTLLFGRGAV